MPLYDSEENVCGISYNGKAYYFVKNLQGDVIAITDNVLNTVARYSYDAWGKCSIVSDTSEEGIATVNPFRYRSYYFDNETGLYYLNSRYYDPEVARFINADDTAFLGVSGTSLSYNLFAYCENNPVNFEDPTGHYNTTLVISNSVISLMSGALPSIIASISASVAGIKTAISTSWFVPVCIAATAIAIIGIVSLVKKVNHLIFSATQIISAVKSKVKSKGISDKNLKGYTVYVIARKNKVDVVYVGITKNYKARYKKHTSKRFPKSKYDMYPIATGLSKSQARAMEQTIISAYTLDTLRNMINSISPKKWNNFKLEFEQMNTLIQSWIDPE